MYLIESQDAARLDDLLPPRRLPRGRHGPLHGSLLLGELFRGSRSLNSILFAPNHKLAVGISSGK